MPEARAVGALLKSLTAACGWLLGLLPMGALAAPVTLCAGQVVAPDATGRVLGHLPYGEAVPIDLVAMPASFGLGRPCRLQRGAAADLTRMLRDAAKVPGVGATLRGVSCYRSVVRQRTVFCGKIGPGKAVATAAQRARFVGPPGYSEHATGYAIDFGIRPSPGCGDVEACIADKAAGRWLLAHAREYGFELSFPTGNAQGVTWEPWHWRWVGVSIDTPGAIAARAIFTRARASYPASPAVGG